MITVNYYAVDTTTGLEFVHVERRHGHVAVMAAGIDRVYKDTHKALTTYVARAIKSITGAQVVDIKHDGKYRK